MDKVCGSGHAMTAVPVCGSVRLVCLTCLCQARQGPAGVIRGSAVKTYRLVELVTQLEGSENGDEFGALNVADVPGFDALFVACDRSGTPFTADGLRKLARRIAARMEQPVAFVMGKKPEDVAELVKQFRLRPAPVGA